ADGRDHRRHLPPGRERRRAPGRPRHPARHLHRDPRAGGHGGLVRRRRRRPHRRRPVALPLVEPPSVTSRSRMRRSFSTLRFMRKTSVMLAAVLVLTGCGQQAGEGGLRDALAAVSGEGPAAEYFEYGEPGWWRDLGGDGG